MTKRKSYRFLVSGQKLNDTDIKELVYLMEGERVPMMVYKFAYTPPYEKNSMYIKKFQYRSAYKPFEDETKKRKIAAINMTEWIGHEKDEKLERFAKFLHDYQSFFRFRYVLVAENASKDEVKDLSEVMSEYLGRCYMIEAKREDEKEEG